MVKDKNQMKALDDIYFITDDFRPAGLSLEHQLHPVQSFFILPLFALFKAGVSFDTESVTQLGGTISLGIILGLFFGKQLGIMFFSWLAVRLGKTTLPEGISWSQIWGVSILAGVGFTMSIFISDLAFNSAVFISQAKIAIISASLLSGVAGFLILSRVLGHKNKR